MRKNRALDVLFLTDKDVRSLLTMRDALGAVESAFKEKGFGRVQMPPKLYIFFKEYSGDLRVMPAYLERIGVAGVKVVNVHPRNPAKYGLPTVMATIVLIDPKSGAPICIMDGTRITAMRTGGAGGVAVKYLARKDSKVIGMIGAGTQARTQLMALKEVLPKIDKVRVFDKVTEHGEKYADEMGSSLGLDIRPVYEAREAVYGSDIVVTTTPSTEPVVMDEWVGNGTHINSIGADAPGKEELDPAVLKRAKIVVDDFEQAVHGGEINVPVSRGLIGREDIYAEIGEVVAGKKAGRTSDDEVTVFVSTGLAVQDVSTAWTVYKKAERLGVGKNIKMF